MMVPVSSLSGTAQIMGRAFPMTYFMPISVGTFTKGLGFADLGRQSRRTGAFHSGTDTDQPFVAAQAGTLGAFRCACSAISSGWAPRNCAASFAIIVLVGFVVYAFSLADHWRRRTAIRRRCTTPRSRWSTKIIRNCRGGSPARFCRPISSRRSRSPSGISCR